MAYKYDIETFISDIEDVFKANLNSKIDEINIEKQTASPVPEFNWPIENIPDDAWYFFNIPSNWSYSKFVVFSLSGIELLSSQYDGHIQQVSVAVEIATVDEGTQVDQSQIYELLRYMRCLQEIAVENFDKLRGYGKITVESLPPALFDVSGKILKTSGVNITASFDI